MYAVDVKPRHRALAERQPLTRHAFAEAFRRSQRPVKFEAAWFETQAETEVEQHALAFAKAEAERFLPDLVRRIVHEAPSRGFLEAAQAAGVTFGQGTLQAILDLTDPALPTGIFAQHLPRFAGQVCRVLIDGMPKGTGFLVAPRVVATAYHVLADLLDYDDGAQRWVGRPDAHRRLVFEFGHQIIEIDGARSAPDTQKIRAHPDWLVASSECHSDEWQGPVQPAAATLEGCYDYALCRLASIVGLGFKGIRVEETRRLGTETTHITILQHPDGRPLCHHRAEADRIDGPAFRVLHHVNTESGSSGAPCFSDDLRVVAIHQAGRDNGPYHRDGVSANTLNRCVPIFWMLEALQGLEITDAGLMPISALDDGTVVIGRSGLVRWIFDTLEGSRGVAPILSVERDKLPGLTFTIRLMRTLLPAAQHRILEYDMRQFEGLDLAVAMTLLRETAGVAEQRATGDALTTPAAELRYEEGGRLVADLRADEAMQTWMVLKNFDRGQLDPRPGGVRDLFDLLFQRAGAGLRFVLLRRGAGLALPDAVARYEVERLRRPTRDEIETLLVNEGALSPTTTPRTIDILLTAMEQLFEQHADDATFYAPGSPFHDAYVLGRA